MESTIYIYVIYYINQVSASMIVSIQIGQIKYFHSIFSTKYPFFAANL